MGWDWITTELTSLGSKLDATLLFYKLDMNILGLEYKVNNILHPPQKTYLGPEVSCLDWIGQDRTGQDRTRRDRTGQQKPSRDRTFLRRALAESAQAEAIKQHHAQQNSQ